MKACLRSASIILNLVQIVFSFAVIVYILTNWDADDPAAA